MSMLKEKFAQLRQQQKTALVPFITAGDPLPEITVDLMQDLVAGGADMIELGIPFSDPMADGPVIQRASERALEYHVSLRDVLEMVSRFRQMDRETPVILMGYLNPIEIMGYQIFAEQAAEAGVDGVLVVDLPPEEGQEFQQTLQQHGLDQIYLVAPTSTASRIERICELSGGFVYYVSVKGVTGASHLDIKSLDEKLKQIRENTDLPVGVGFGIKDAETAAAVSQVADAVVVGSALVSRVEALADQPEKIGAALRELLSNMRQAMDNAVHK
ncbi:MAG: tryptophan synthase subunit alpha [Candidatus Thiodiazotropha lotti]|uniref:Tryptophan synthase alpha chain n=1 Tax=Candidatus Thiodiazotropha endoloripes TaxID=1818881 RepID=A0A1E2UUM6_9GAMM|nr:tryptophan synthase subunit alpha [Candidatus Thiodiazotropha endoloripes]MCG7897088.1 tryptophan synthase subunit alpha [Candidatus Thiodiazotropha weberae]MCG7991136.1 tryptophan synthase subunit alpha [Candidatus Thiodiazotropha lotti]MCG7902949.1 tryptophan synthase subunit alpha [Candidatus Thiodiazotropha weberae]MCG7915007.1 tryptophan synthase subunit alpha [Candidatus Thiodiazotropha weberae]MCG8001346.1 tryptophan synthase subunit alpha [Candidatus Thiodiazotropha lotti]